MRAGLIKAHVTVITFITALVFAVSIGNTADARDETSHLTLGGGMFDVFDDQESAQFQIQYRHGKRLLWHFKPFFGAMGNTDRAANIYAGIRLDIYFGDHVVLTPNFAPSLYFEGDSKDLGHVLEFRSGVELALRFDNESRLGVAIHHLSNASIGDDNPGTETVTLFYSHPFTDLDNLFDF